MNWLASKLTAPVAIGFALLLALATATVGVKLWVANHDLAAMTKRADAVAVDLGQARANERALELSVKGMNVRLDQMKADADLREADRKSRDAMIDAGLAKTMSALAAVKPGPDKCASATGIIREFSK